MVYCHHLGTRRRAVFGAHELQRGMLRADGRAKRSDEPCGRRAFTGCNWQSVDQIEFDMPGPVVIGVHALYAGGIGGFFATVQTNEAEYPSPKH